MEKEKFWTPERLERVKEFRAQGRSFGQIAGWLGTTRGAVMSVYHRRIVETDHPSRRKGYEPPVYSRGREVPIPTLPYVTGLSANNKYTMVMR